MRNQSTRQCRICLEEIKRFDYQSAVRPCKCKGTQQFVHHKCLKNWLDFSKRTQCQVCLFKFEKFKRKDGCEQIAQNLIKSRRVDLVLYVIILYMFYLNLLNCSINNFFKFTFQVYPSTTMLVCSQDYDNITHQLKNGTLTQNQLNFVCNYAINRIKNNGELPYIIDPVLIYLYDQMTTIPSFWMKNSSSYSKDNLTQSLDKEQNFSDVNRTTANLNGNLNTNQQKQIYRQNSSQNHEILDFSKDSSSVFNVNLESHSKPQHSNLTDNKTQNTTQTENHKVPPTKMDAFLYNMHRFLVLAFDIFALWYTTRSFIQCILRHLKYVDQNFRGEHLCFVEYKKTKRYQITKLQRQLDLEQQQQANVNRV
eukprot:403349301